MGPARALPAGMRGLGRAAALLILTGTPRLVPLRAITRRLEPAFLLLRSCLLSARCFLASFLLQNLGQRSLPSATPELQRQRLLGHRREGVAQGVVQIVVTTMGVELHQRLEGDGVLNVEPLQVQVFVVLDLVPLVVLAHCVLLVDGPRHGFPPRVRPWTSSRPGESLTFRLPGHFPR